MANLLKVPSRRCIKAMHMHRARDTASQVRAQSACTQFALLIILLPVAASQQHFIPSRTNFFHILDLLLASPDLADVLQRISTTGVVRSPGVGRR